MLVVLVCEITGSIVFHGPKFPYSMAQETVHFVSSLMARRHPLHTLLPNLQVCMPLSAVYMVMLAPDKLLTMERFLATCNRLTGTYAPFSWEVVDLYSPGYILGHI